MLPHDWRHKDENWQKRHFVLSAFVRMKIPLTKDVYEFCDYIISQGYSFSLSCLNEVDIEVRREYQKYLQIIS